MTLCSRAQGWILRSILLLWATLSRIRVMFSYHWVSRIVAVAYDDGILMLSKQQTDLGMPRMLSQMGQ